MKRKAIISVTGLDSKAKNVELISSGKFYQKDGMYYAEYAESEISGMEGTTTMFQIDRNENKMTLVRMGTTNTKMEFKKNKDDLVLYNTPYGAIELKVDTNNINIDVDETGGEIVIDYKINILGQTNQKTCLKIDIKAQ